MHLVDHARVHVEDTYRRPWPDRLIRAVLAAVLPYPARFRAALAAAWLPGRVLAAFSGRVAPGRKAIPAGEGFAALIGRVGAMLRLTPARPHGPSPYQAPGVFPAEGPRRGRVALLQGCAQSVLAPSINEAAIRLLTRNGIEVVFAAGEGCCGSLVHHMGRENQALTQARQNIDAWTHEIEGGEVDAILVTASGCGTTIKDYGFMLRGDAAYAGKAAQVSKLAKDVSEYLTLLGLQAPLAKTGLTVAYQSACSLQHGQKITRQPKELLVNAGFRVSDIPEAHLCCGSAGTYNIMQPAIATALRDRKVANIETTGAHVIATGNIGCMTQLAPATRIPVVHTVELLDWAHGGPPPEALKHVRIGANDSRRIANAT
jgi:glycolate oxidase iron-sulfur subunit